MKKLIASLIFLLISSFAFAQNTYHWEFAGWYGGGCYPNVEFDPHNKDRVFLTSDVAGIWRSDDLGEHWHFVNKGLGHLIVSQVAVAPSDSHVLYAATGGGVFYSLNDGDEWKAADTANKQIIFKRPQNYRSLIVDPTDAAHLCIGTFKGEMYCSNYHGDRWDKIDPPDFLTAQDKPIAALQFSHDASKLWVGFSNVLAVYDFQSARWESLGEFKNITDFIITDAKMYVASEHSIWFKGKDEANWSQTSSVPKGDAYRIALAEGKLYTAWLKNWDGGVAVSNDEGKHWDDLNNMIPDMVLDPTRHWAQKNTRITSLKIDPFDPKIIFRSDYWGVWRSDDAGQTWNEKILGAPDTVGSGLLVTTDAIYAATMDNGLLKSTDGGATYKPLFPKDKYKDDENGHVWRVALSGTNIVATSSPWNKKINQVLLSQDGEHFQLIREGLPSERPIHNTVWGEGYPRALAVDPKNPNNIYLGMDGDQGGGLFISNDGGKTWNRSPGQPGSLRIYHGLVVDPNNPNIIIWGATGNHGGVYISYDKGQTFNYVQKSMQWVFNVAIDRTSRIYAGGDSNGHPTLFVADSPQKPFRMLEQFKDQGVGRAIDAIAINPKDPRMIAISTVHWSNGSPCLYFLSRDAGKSWEEINGDLPEGAGSPAMTFDPSGETLYISRYAGSIYKVKI